MPLLDHSPARARERPKGRASPATPPWPMAGTWSQPISRKRVMAILCARSLPIFAPRMSSSRSRRSELAAQALAQVKAKRKDKNFAERAHVQKNGFRRRARFPLLRLCASCASRPAAGPHPAGLLLILGGLLSFLPILGIWMLRLGLLLLAEDLPVLRSRRSRILDLIERHRP
jgi:hypothetical protein